MSTDALYRWPKDLQRLSHTPMVSGSEDHLAYVAMVNGARRVRVTRISTDEAYVFVTCSKASLVTIRRGLSHAPPLGMHVEVYRRRWRA